MKKQKWIFNWKYGLIAFILTLSVDLVFSFETQNPTAKLAGYLTGMVIVSVLSGWDKKLRL